MTRTDDFALRAQLQSELDAARKSGDLDAASRLQLAVQKLESRMAAEDGTPVEEP